MFEDSFSRFVHQLAYLRMKCISLPFAARSSRFLSVTATISSTECSVCPENDSRTETSCPCSTFQCPLTEALYPRLSSLNFASWLMVPSARYVVSTSTSEASTISRPTQTPVILAANPWSDSAEMDATGENQQDQKSEALDSEKGLLCRAPLPPQGQGET